MLGGVSTSGYIEVELQIVRAHMYKQVTHIRFV